jgi:putative peptide zinc metalloprotease protein
VYHFFFKASGLLLFVVEIVWFFVTPIMKEIKVWNTKKESIRESSRYRLTTVICFIVLSLFFIPWNLRITIHAILQATIYSVSPGVIKEVYARSGDKVRQGQSILILDLPGLDDEIARTLRKYDVTELRSKRRASNDGDLANMQVVL